MKKFIDIIKNKWLRKTVTTIALVLILVAIFFILNQIFINAKIAPIDFTEEKLYSLSEDSKQQIAKVDQNVDIYFFGFKESDNAVILGRQYHDINNKINVNLISIDDRPDLASKYGVARDQALIALSSNQRNKVIDRSELYTFDSTTYETLDISEQKITNGILDITVATRPQVYFLTGHGELALNEGLYELSNELVNGQNDVYTLDLLTSDMPEKCDTLIIANPTKDFTIEETEKIKTYINNGGNIVWLQDPYISIKDYNDASFPNAKSILAMYGVSFGKGLVCETSTSNMIVGYPDVIIPEMSYNSIVKDLYTDGKIVFFDSCKIDMADEAKLNELKVTASPFVTTTENAFYKESVTGTDSFLQKGNNDLSGRFNLAELVEKKITDDKKSTLVAFANATYITSYTVQLGNSYGTPITLRNNKDIILNTVSYLTNREDAIRIRKDTGNVVFATLTEQQDIIVKIIIFTIPAAIILAGIIITIVRKNKK